MNWEILVANIKEFFNQPVIIIITSIVSTVVGVITVISKTSFGKKAIRQLTKTLNNVKDESDVVRETSKLALELANKEINRLRDEYGSKLTEVYNQFDVLEKGIIEVLENIPNAKVKKALENFNATYQEKKKAITLFVQETYEEHKAVVEQVKNEYQAKLDDLRAEINEIREIIKPVENALEEVENGEENE